MSNSPDRVIRSRAECLSEMRARWAEYDQLSAVDRALVDDKRLVPVPETRRLLAWWRTARCEHCGVTLDPRDIGTCRACTRNPDRHIGRYAA